MKKRILACFLVGVFLLSCFLTGCGEKTIDETESAPKELKKITLNEVAHSIFYAPQYVAIEKGYFKEEGLDVNLVNGAGADNTMTAVVSGEAEIGFMGSEASIYVYNEGAEDYIVNFAQLTQRAGNFLVAKEADSDFKWDKLKGKTVLGGRAGGMPQMVFEYILKKNNIDPAKDLKIVQNIDFGLTAQAFASGQGEYTVEFEPFAAGLEADKKGVVVASLGEASGNVPYTAYSAKASYLEKNPEVVQSFTNAIQKGMKFVQENDAETIAKVIQPQFKETELSKITTIVDRYRQQDTWKDNLVFEKESFELLKDILDEAGVLEGDAPYDKLVTKKFAQEAVQ